MTPLGERHPDTRDPRALARPIAGRRRPAPEEASMDSYDVIIIGTGAGGGTLARHLAPSGKRVLVTTAPSTIRPVATFMAPD